MTLKEDIRNLEDITLLVNTFYSRIRENELLAPLFNDRIQDRWPQHLEKMVRFWQTVLLEEHTYNGAPFMPHANMPLVEEHFNSWVNTWCNTVDDLFYGPLAEEAKWRGNRMATMFLSKIEYYRGNNAIPLL